MELDIRGSHGHCAVTRLGGGDEVGLETDVTGEAVQYRHLGLCPGDPACVLRVTHTQRDGTNSRVRVTLHRLDRLLGCTHVRVRLELWRAGRHRVDRVVLNATRALIVECDVGADPVVLRVRFRRHHP